MTLILAENFFTAIVITSAEEIKIYSLILATSRLCTLAYKQDVLKIINAK